ncbi:hypothetical protein QA646_09850 [Rhizobium sp. CB3090]|uniref:hypothetical protein n=1 Tax=Rhizobium sp. CB3090 TaxID=3039156 RepID=UPI0024B1BC30|nr:hypothetical protein [Rhizobium sp. CB3090]WFU07634.1 hypothetical protein QA646_09850 [Rhizobium sp. CB3090]
MRFDRRADLEQLRKRIAKDIEAQAADARGLFITLAPGQDTVYRLKGQEALSIVADRQQGVNVPDGETPHITAEAAEDGVSRFEKAIEILARDQHWTNAAMMIESLRRSAKAALAAAATAPEIRAAAVIDWRDVRAYAQT